MKKVISLVILILTLFSPIGFALAQGTSAPAEVPKTLEEAKSLGEKFLEGLPEVIKQGFKELINWLKNLWDSYIFPFFKYIWQGITSFLGKEVEERKPAVEEEFEKEKEEMKEEIKEELPKAGKSLWQRFKELIK